MSTTKLSDIQRTKKAANTNAFSFLTDRVDKSSKGFAWTFIFNGTKYRIATDSLGVIHKKGLLEINTPTGEPYTCDLSGADDYLVMRQRLVTVTLTSSSTSVGETGFSLVTLFSANSFLKERWAGKLLHGAKILEGVGLACKTGRVSVNLNDCLNAVYESSCSFLRLVLFVNNTEESALIDEFNASVTIHGHNARCLSRFWNADTAFDKEVKALTRENCLLLRRRFCQAQKHVL